jgi:CDP-paratose 2-epimerase
MNLLITGGCGFLGSNLAAAAIERGDRVTVFDNLSRHGSIDNLNWLKRHGDFEFVHADIRSPNDVDRTIQTLAPEVVFHLAGQVAMTTSIADPRRDFEINTLGTFNVVDAIRRHAPDAALLYSSTNKVYGDLSEYAYVETATRWVCPEHPNGFGEDTPLSFHSPYGCSKGAADQYVLDAHRMWGMKTVVFRHSSMYGGRQFATVDQGWIGWFCQQALLQATDHSQGRPLTPFTISGDGKQVRDVLHASDMVSLYFAAVERIEEVSGEAFNVGGGSANSLSLLELFQHLRDMLQLDLPFERLPARSSDQLVFVADISKVERRLRWSPQIGVVDGLRAMLDWQSSQMSQ